MSRITVRRATPRDLDLLVRHRRGMWEAIAEIPRKKLDAADRIYRHWARARMRSGRLVGFIVDVGGESVASGCVWLMDVQPRPHWEGTRVTYLLSMFTEPAHRGEGHATRIVRAAMSWSRKRGIYVILLHASRYGEPVYTRLGFERMTEMRRFLDRPPRRRVRRRPKSSTRSPH